MTLRRSSLAAVAAVGLIRVYQVAVSPLLHALAGPGAGCRFVPTCSEYARQAVLLHGVRRGSWLSVRRVCRCHPWGAAGIDPVPPPAEPPSGFKP